MSNEKMKKQCTYYWKKEVMRRVAMKKDEARMERDEGDALFLFLRKSREISPIKRGSWKIVIDEDVAAEMIS